MRKAKATTILTLPLSIAPMIDWTYNHFRVFMRILAPKALLYTEMLTTGAVLNNPKLLSFNAIEHPIAIQLGGSDAKALAQCAMMAEEAGYDEINLNLGCPSDKVQAGRFGACLMKEASRVAECIEAMRRVVSIPVSAKTRIGIDQQDSYAFFSSFVEQLINAGCQKLVVHARKAWLQGLNPKQNRTIPPLHYEYVYRIKSEYPKLPVHINGNISTSTEIRQHLHEVDGVMLGRLACDNPYQIARIHHSLYSEVSLLSYGEILKRYLHYVLLEIEKGAAFSKLMKPLFNLSFGLPGSKEWKRTLMGILQAKKIKDLNSTLAIFENKDE